MRDITPLVAPESIAVIGASTNPEKSGGILFNNLLQGDFSGPLYPINPRATEVMGCKAYPSIEEVGKPIDLAYVVLPRQFVKDTISQCAKAGVRAACIITAGFSEVGDSGRKDEEELRELAQTHGILLAGPNTIGMVNAECGMMGSFVNFPKWESGPISLFTQTGIFTGALMLQIMSQETQRLPVGKSIDVGNKVDVDEMDFLEFAAGDESTKVIGFYLESLRNPRAFLERAGEIAATKPIVVLKPGRTEAGARASSSHTGSLATDDALLDAGLRQYGIVRAQDEQEFINILRVFAPMRLPGGRRLAIATTSGALGVISSDLATDYGLELAEFSPQTIDKLRQILPDWLEPANPFDFWIGIDVKGPEVAHRTALKAIVADPNSDMVLCTLLAPPNADFQGFGELIGEVCQANPHKPIIMVIHGGEPRKRWIEALEGLSIPVYTSTREALSALAALAGRGGRAGKVSGASRRQYRNGECFPCL